MTHESEADSTPDRSWFLGLILCLAIAAVVFVVAHECWRAIRFFIG